MGGEADRMQKKTKKKKQKGKLKKKRTWVKYLDKTKYCVVVNPVYWYVPLVLVAQ